MRGIFRDERRKMELIGKIEEAAREAGEIMLNASDIRNKISEKDGWKNIVTDYDKQVQSFLEKRLLEILPGARFMGEENHEDQFLDSYRSGWLFVNDPIDGTTNFVAGYRPSVTSIALLKDGEPYIGVVYNPYTGDMFSAMRGNGAKKNGEPIKTSSQPLERSIISIGTSPYYGEAMITRSFERALRFMLRCVDIRRSGSAVWDSCLVADGTAGLFMEENLQIWDYAAAAIIVEEAGGTVTDYEGKPVSYRGASNVIFVSSGVAEGEYLSLL